MIKLKKLIGEENNRLLNMCSLITYKIEKAKIKNIYIKVQDGQVIVKCPPKTPEKYIKDLVNKKSEWIEKRLEEYKKREKSNNLENMTLVGNEYKVNIKYKESHKIEVNVEKQVEISFPQEFKNREIDKEIKKQIIDAIYKKVIFEETKLAMDKYTRITGLVPKQWRVRKIKTAWGSCSSNKNITISSNLAPYSRQTIEYVVLHELVHLKHMNHSKEFWKMIENYIPNYKEIRKQLK